MKNVFLFIMLMLICGIWTSLNAQVTPAGAGDKNLENRDVKGRSVELERVSRDTDKENRENSNKSSASKFSEIKEDFEKMQMANSDIQKSMVAIEKSYKTINDSSAQINKSAVRLKSNLFPNVKPKKSKDKNKPDAAGTAAAAAPPQDLKSMTDMLNVAIFDFTHNPMFSDPKFTGDDSAKAQSDLEKIANVSSAIEKQTEKN